ncbi:ABC transporter permease, partial [Kitasatospora sp. NPDC059571]
MKAYAGTGILLRLALRRDRIVLPVWLYALTASVASTAFSFRTLYGTAAERQAFGLGIASNSSLRALYGPLHDASTVGGLTAWRMGAFGAVLAALMSILLVVRHTRAEEEDGRLELIGAGAVGRRAPLTAGLLAAACADLLLAVLVSGCLIAAGQAPAGSLAFGLALGGSGLLFAGVAAVAAQVAGTARAANGIAGTVLAAAFVLRAAGDAGPHRVVLLSPLGWAEEVRPFAGDRWWLLVLSGAAAAAAVGAAYLLVERRDLGAGLLPQRPGPAAGAPGLRTGGGRARGGGGGAPGGGGGGGAGGGAGVGGVAL